VLDLVARVGGENLSALGGGHQSELTAHDVSLGVQLTIPIFTGGMRDAKLGESRALADKAGYELEAARLRAGQSARAAWQGLTVGQSRVKALEQALASSQVRLDATRLGKDVGDRTGLDVLNAEQEHYSAMRELAQARYQLLLSYLSLYASAGELTEQRLGEVNAALMANH
jgi:outer membrane protein